MHRRHFSGLVAGGLASLPLGLQAAAGRATSVPPVPAQGDAGRLSDVPGVKVGHFTDARRPTGCTVVLVEAGANAGVDVRGGAPGTRETDLLDPVNTVQQVHAIVLSGGSAFGLDAATGVMRFLEERGVGFPVGSLRVPIVPAAILFDLGVGDGRIRPDATAGYAAARAAGVDTPAEGNVGAGAGASVGKLLGFERAMRGGLGSASERLPDGLIVAALVAVNAVGDVRDPRSGVLVAGARTPDGRELADTLALLRAGGLAAAAPADPRLRGNTTIGVVATNAALGKTELTKVAQMAQDGLARTIQPVHTPWDGDTLFALGLGTQRADVLVVGTLAAEAVANAVLRAVRAARSLPGLPAAADLAAQATSR